jgi:hypothetical protein
VGGQPKNAYCRIYSLRSHLPHPREKLLECLTALVQSDALRGYFTFACLMPIACVTLAHIIGDWFQHKRSPTNTKKFMSSLLIVYQRFSASYLTVETIFAAVRKKQANLLSKKASSCFLPLFSCKKRRTLSSCCTCG